jgi:hypothetical protein
MMSSEAAAELNKAGHQTTQPPQVDSVKEEATVFEAENGIKLRQDGELPSPEAVIEALGIPNWRDLEKKAVRRLDMTLMPCL